MSGKATLLLEYGAGLSTECSGALLEFPKQAVDPGEAVRIVVWGASAELLAGYELLQGATSLGVGAAEFWPGQTTCAYFDLAGEAKSHQFDYPIESVSRVLAFSDLYYLDAGRPVSWAATGADVTASFYRCGYSCLKARPEVPKLYGTIHATASRSPHARAWAWTAPGEPRGDLWFFVRKNGAITREFALKLSEEPEDESVQYVDAKLRIVSRKTAGAILGADVWLAGAYLGKSDLKYGYVKALTILSGTYPVRVAATGYPATDADNDPDNDSVTILPSGEEVRVLVGNLL